MKTISRKEIKDHFVILEAIKNIPSIRELADIEANNRYKFGVDLEICLYGRNYGGNKKVGPYIKMYEYLPGKEIIHQGDWDTNTFFIVTEGITEVFLNGNVKAIASLKAGDTFGEMGVLAGVPRAATIKAHTKSSIKLLEVQRPAIRILRKLSKFGKALDITYRGNSRQSTIGALNLGEDLKKRLHEISEFKILSRGHIFSSEGTVIDKMFLMKDGWIKRSSTDGTGELVDYIGAGFCLGINALMFPGARWPFNATVLSRTEVLEIPVKNLLGDGELAVALREALNLYSSVGTPLQPFTALNFDKAEKETQSRVLDKGLADVNNLLLMDMDLCVRCGNCSLACQKIHGQSRLTRRGIHIVRAKSLEKHKQNLLVPSVCFHCKDPECLTGCPTGAIARFPNGQVDIISNLCIGCGDCATQCPYNAISLIQKGNKKDKDITDSPKTFLKKTLKLLNLKYPSKPNPVTAEEDLLAVKCNLCVDTPLNPIKNGELVYKDRKYNCEEMCPTGALMRVNPVEHFDEINRIMGKAFHQNGTEVYGRSFNYWDKGKVLMHVLGILITLILCGLTTAGIVQYGLGTPLLKTNWFNFRWVTGLVGLLGIIVVMTYPVRRQIWKKRAGPLRYWMLAHTYAGVLAGVILLLHGGTKLGGILTACLMISFDLVILTGLLGILVYWIGPRILTNIEEEPLLIEDLIRRREELYQEIADLTVTTKIESEKNNNLDFTNKFLNLRDSVLRRTMSLKFLMRQYLKRETLDNLIKDTKKIFKSQVIFSSIEREQNIFNQLIAAAVTSRRIDALVYVHRALKLWLPPHVIFTSIMLGLLLVHIIQVIYYLWR